MLYHRLKRVKKAKTFSIPVFGNENALTKTKRKKEQEGVSYKTKRRARGFSAYKKKLFELNSIKYLFGVSTKTLKRILRSSKGRLDVALNSLGLRLDNLVYEGGIVKSRKGARQLISHGKIKVNSFINNNPGSILKIGDTISLVEPKKKQSKENTKEKERGRIVKPKFLEIIIPRKRIKLLAAITKYNLEEKIIKKIEFLIS